MDLLLLSRIQFALTIMFHSTALPSPMLLPLPKTLMIILYVALIGMPLVLGYIAVIYWIFRGKVKLDEHSY